MSRDETSVEIAREQRARVLCRSAHVMAFRGLAAQLLYGRASQGGGAWVPAGLTSLHSGGREPLVIPCYSLTGNLRHSLDIVL